MLIHRQELTKGSSVEQQRHAGSSMAEPAFQRATGFGAEWSRRGGPLLALTKRERAVLRLLARGKRNQDAAEALCITRKTVEFHVSNILRKMGVRSRTAAVSLAWELGWLRPG